MTDLISRQAVIDVIKKHYRICDDLLEVIAYEDLFEVIAHEIERLPSAQPCTDTISRQEAIDAFDKEIWSNIDIPICKGIRSAVKKTIEQLPPVQPEHKIHFADVDHVWIDGKQYISLGRFQEAVVEAQPERKTGRWIKDEKSYAGSGLSNYLCDQCGECGGTWRSDLKPHQFPKFCMWCGSPMEVEHDSDKTTT